jgi:DNA-binding transcriptional ArsR family regulator
MRALAHPTRLALLEMLGIHGPLTATQAGALIGESPSSCSFHLRTLARHHFVEETGDGLGRQRPWRLVNLGMSISKLHLDDQDTVVAAHALAQLFAERQLTRLRQWWGRRDRAAPAWVDATSQSESIAWLTPDELRRVNDAVRTAISGFDSRLVDPTERPDGAELVELIYFSYPFGPGPTYNRAPAPIDDLDPVPTDDLGLGPTDDLVPTDDLGLGPTDDLVPTDELVPTDDLDPGPTDDPAPIDDLDPVPIDDLDLGPTDDLAPGGTDGVVATEPRPEREPSD